MSQKPSKLKNFQKPNPTQFKSTRTQKIHTIKYNTRDPDYLGGFILKTNFSYSSSKSTEPDQESM